MIKIAHFGDLQLGLSRFDGAYSAQRERDFYDAWTQGVREAAREGVELVLIAGDVFDSATPPTAAQQAFLAGLDFLDRCDIEVIVVDGNHERPKNRTIRHPLALAANFTEAGVTYGDFPEIYSVKGYEICAIPFQHGKELEQPPRADIVMVHGGCDALPEYMSSSGYVWKTEWDRNHKYVALGDWHGPKICGPASRYSGSIERTSFGEAGVPVGFWLITLDDHGKIVDQRHVSTEQRPMHTYEITLSEIDGGNVKDAIVERLSEYHPEDLIRLTIRNSAPLDLSDLKKQYPFLKVRWRARKTRKSADPALKGITMETQWQDYCSQNEISVAARNAALELFGEVNE